jgi:hypothetical protein
MDDANTEVDIQPEVLIEMIAFVKEKHDGSARCIATLKLLTQLFAIGQKAKQDEAFGELNELARIILMHNYGAKIMNLCRNPAPDPRPPTREPSI